MNLERGVLIFRRTGRPGIVGRDGLVGSVGEDIGGGGAVGGRETETAGGRCSSWVFGSRVCERRGSGSISESEGVEEKGRNELRGEGYDGNAFVEKRLDDLVGVCKTEERLASTSTLEKYK